MCLVKCRSIKIWIMDKSVERKRNDSSLWDMKLESNAEDFIQVMSDKCLRGFLSRNIVGNLIRRDYCCWKTTLVVTDTNAVLLYKLWKRFLDQDTTESGLNIHTYYSQNNTRLSTEQSDDFWIWPSVNPQFG